jgi:hypothetical protein
MMRKKGDARTRMDIGVARVLMREGKDARESLEAFRAHVDIVRGLEEQSPPAPARETARPPKSRSVS